MNTSAEEWQDYIEPLTRTILVAVGLIQGVIFYLLLKWLPQDIPSVALFVTYSLLLALPWMLVIIARDVRDPWLWYLLLAYALVLLCVSAFIGSQCGERAGNACFSNIGASYLATQLLCWCLLSIVFRTLVEQQRLSFPYETLFKYSWHNFFIIVLAALYTGLIWLLLFLGAGLFKLVDIRLFWDTLEQSWFRYPLTGAALAYGAVVSRQQLTVVTTLRRVLRTMIGGLLPLLALISICFLVVLPATGLQPLWDTKRASTLMLWQAALLLFFANASIQYGGDQLGRRGWVWLVRGALVLLPVYLALTAYALWLRIDQYGWTVSRVWAVIVTLVLAGYALSYAANILIKRDNWTQALGTVNTLMLGCLVAVLLITNSPLINVHQIVANNQVSRLLEGKTPLADFDYQYLQAQLGKPGSEALSQLLVDPGFSALPGHERLARLIKNGARYEPSERSLADYVNLLPPELEVPTALMKKLDANTQFEKQRCAQMGSRCYLTQLELESGVMSYVLISAGRGYMEGRIYQQVDENWQPIGRIADYQWSAEPIDYEAHLESSGIQVVEPRWKDIQIGDRRLSVQPDYPGMIFNRAIARPIQPAQAVPLN